MAEVASAYVTLIPSARGFASGVTKETDRAATTAGKRFGGIFSGSLKGVIGGALAGLGVTRLIGDALGEAREAQKVGALTANVIKTTGGVANVSAKQVESLATAISNKVGIDDEAIQSGENLLLTFKNVRNEVGKGNDVFDRATQAAVDLSASGFGDLSGTSKQLGKALNDPIKGITALARAGVTFTDQQKEQIKTLVESNRSLDAQKIILKEVESQVGGSAAAQATASDKARVALGNLEEQIGTALLPVVDDLANKVSKDVVPAISEFITEMQDGTGAGGEVVDVLKDMVGVGKGVFEFFDGLPGPVKKYGAELAIGLVVMSKFSSGIRTMAGTFALSSAQIEAGVTRQQLAMSRLRSGVGMLAGAGGMLLLADSTQRAAGDMSTLEMAAGGALSGAALGAFAGPAGAAVGGAIGGIAGLAGGLARQLKADGDNAGNAGPKIQSYIDTLDDLTGALTGATKAQALKTLQDNHGIEEGRQLGLSSTTLVNASLGIPSAMKKVSAAVNDVTKAYDENGAIVADANGHFTKAQERALDLSPAISDLTRTLGLNREGLKADQQAWTDNQIAVGNYKKALPGIPKDVVTKIGTIGIEKADASITRLTAKYKLTPEQVKTILEAAGERPSVAKIQHVIDKAKEFGGLRPKPTIDANTEPARTKVSALVRDIHNLLSGNFTAMVDASVAGPKKRATGGPVLAGQAYIVGERRAELFVPNQSGRIVPQVPTSSATGSSVDSEQSAYRAFSRALATHQVVIMPKRSFDALDLVVAG